MARFLPPQVNLEHLKNEAKDLLKSHAKGDAAVCDTFRRLARFSQADDRQILSASIKLTEAQYALAMDYGFISWEQLRKTVLAHQPLEGSQSPPQHGALFLPKASPAACKGSNRFPSGLHLALSCCGVECDYDTVAGDSGMAFIIQADSLHTAWGAKRKELDIGFWPVDFWGALLRLDFLGQVYGHPLRAMLEHEQEYAADEAGHFRKYFQEAVVQSLRDGRPVLALEQDMYVVTGFDGGNPPLLGQLSCSDVAETKRMNRYPWTVVVMDEATAPMDRAAADIEAINFAIKLHHDQFGANLPGKFSGKGAFALWTRMLRDAEMCGPNFYHANVMGHLKRARRSVPSYLRQMVSRHGNAATHLLAAAEVYEQEVTELSKANTSKEAFANAAGREALAHLADEAAIMEGQAVAELEKAYNQMSAAHRGGTEL
jgi:hypothetical protein